MKRLFLLSIIILVAKVSSAQFVSPDSAKYFEGKIITVKGKVMSTFKSQGDKPKIILNIGKPYPDQPFSVVIFADNFGNFSYSPDEELKDKVIHIKGKVTIFKDKPQMIISNQRQIEIE